jgi:hypothetical protein
MKHPDPLTERIAEAMSEHELSNMARLHSVRGSLDFWREFAKIALDEVVERLKVLAKEK